MTGPPRTPLNCAVRNTRELCVVAEFTEEESCKDAHVLFAGNMTCQQMGDKNMLPYLCLQDVNVSKLCCKSCKGRRSILVHICFQENFKKYNYINNYIEFTNIISLKTTSLPFLLPEYHFVIVSTVLVYVVKVHCKLYFIFCGNNISLI